MSKRIKGAMCGSLRKIPLGAACENGKVEIDRKNCS
jgi:hypothetical protein